MKTKDVETDVGSTDLASYILAVTEQQIGRAHV